MTLRAIATARGFTYAAGSVKSTSGLVHLFGRDSDQKNLLVILDEKDASPTHQLIQNCASRWKRYCTTAEHVILVTKDGASCPVHRQRLMALIRSHLPAARQSTVITVEHVDADFLDAHAKPAECTVERNAEAFAETEIRWLVRCALICMIYARGFALDASKDAEHCITYEQYCQLNEREQRKHLTLIGVKGQDHMITMFRGGDFSQKFGKEISDFVRTTKIPRVVLVTGGEKPLPKNIAVELKRLQPQYVVHSLTCMELLAIDGVLLNDLSCVHKVATKEEVAQLRDTYRLSTLSLLPALQDTDFIARYLGLVANVDVVKILRPSATAGNVTYWRHVIDSQTLEGSGGHAGKPVASTKRRPWSIQVDTAPEKEAKTESKGKQAEDKNAPATLIWKTPPVGWQPSPGLGLGGLSSDTVTTGELGEEL